MKPKDPARLERPGKKLQTVGFHDNVRGIEEWYKKFTRWNTVDWVWEQTGHLFVGYLSWSVFWIWLEGHDPDMAEFEGGDVLKVLVFINGLLISILLKEAMDSYRKCLLAIMDFCAHFKTLWYATQLLLCRKNAALRVLTDLHMATYAMSLAAILLKKSDCYGDDSVHVRDIIQKEFKTACFFVRPEYEPSVTNPVYSELLLSSWYRAAGIYNGELQKCLKDARGALKRLLIAQSVRSPSTKTHLLRGMTHLLLASIPICVKHTVTRMMVPIITVVLFSLISYAQEMEDPFGVDRHDLPWAVMLEGLGYVSFRKSSQACLATTLDFFNHFCCSGKVDLDMAEDLFGADLALAPFTGNKHDSGLLHLDVYLTLPKLQAMDIVGISEEENPDLLFPITRELLRNQEEHKHVASVDEAAASKSGDTESSEEEEEEEDDDDE